MAAFLAMDFLLPRSGVKPAWPVIACDQFTSEPDYWEKAEAIVGEAPSTLRLVYPEVWLGNNQDSRIKKIHASMDCYLKSDVLKPFSHSFVYVERRLSTGKVRRGVVGVVDLEQYDYLPKTTKAIRATEKTVTSRIPARVAIRQGAALELSHVLLLADDPEELLLGSLEEKKETFEAIYDVQLMLEGGHLVGRLVTGIAAQEFEAAIASYERKRQEKEGGDALLYCVGDGNHSLASAKAAFEEIKARIGKEAAATHPARFAMVELGNIHDASLEFEPIHRLATHVNPEALLEKLKPFEGSCGHRISWVAGEKSGEIVLDAKYGTLAVGALQGALDAVLGDDEVLDYIHGDEALRRLALKEDSLGFLLPKIKKADFFKSIEIDGVLPRKTFSMGHAQDKRYYTEARAILAS